MGEDRILGTFLDLVRIDSPSGREAGVASYVARRLQAAGMTVVIDDSSARTGSDTGNLVATLPGTAAGTRLVLSAHMDCVQPCEGVEPVVRDGVVFAAGETVLGGDDKAGVAGIIEAIERIAEENRPHPDLRVVLTVAEEDGLTGAKAIDPALVDGDLCLVLDADGPVGGIVVAAPTHYRFKATFWGKSAHAGVAPEEGRSALKMAARAVADMEIGRLDAETTANVGTIVGGTATNVIAPIAEVTGECRSLDRERVEQVRASMDARMREAAEAEGGTVDIVWTKEYEGFRFSGDSPLVRLLEGACRDAGLEPRLTTTGGGSDGNIFSANGVPTLVLSIGMSSVHSLEERISLDDLYALPSLILAIVDRAVR